MHIIWSKGNTKLQKLKTVGFSLPAFKSEDGFYTCPNAGQCASWCYARQGRFITPNVSRAMHNNLDIVRKSLFKFKEQAIADLKRMRSRNTVRIHPSGDFFSQEYLDIWKEIAYAIPNKTFYAYTKMVTLDLWSKLPKNLQIIQSVGGKYDYLIDTNKPHAKVFPTHQERLKAGYVDGTVTDLPAIKGKSKIGLVYHGVKNLTISQARKMILPVIS